MKIYKMIIQKSKYVILLIVCFLLLMSAGDAEVSAAEEIDKDAECSLLLNIPKAYQSELEDDSIPVRLYRIAGVTEAGTYEAIEGFESLELSKLSIEATAKELEEKAAQVVAFLKADVGNGDTVAKPYREFNIVNNKGSVSGLETGLYLLYVKDYVSGTDRYSALPYIIFLPGAFEWQDSNGNKVREWSYDIVAELKFGSNGNVQDPIDPVTPPDKSESENTGDMANTQKLYAIAIFFGLLFIILFLSKRQSKVTE